MTQAVSDTNLQRDRRPALGAEAPAVVGRLVRATGAAILGVSLLTAGFLVLARTPAWWDAFVPAVMIGLLAAFVSLPAVAWGLFGTLYRAVAGYMIAIVLRGAVSVAGLFVAVAIGHHAPVATLAILLPLYMAQLAAECFVLARAVWPVK